MIVFKTEAKKSFTVRSERETTRGVSPAWCARHNLHTRASHPLVRKWSSVGRPEGSLGETLLLGLCLIYQQTPHLDNKHFGFVVENHRNVFENLLRAAFGHDLCKPIFQWLPSNFSKINTPALPLTTFSFCTKNMKRNPLFKRQNSKALDQGWGTWGPRANFGPRGHLIWPASEFSLPSKSTKSRQNEAPRWAGT